MQESFKWALENGLYNTQLDKNYEVRSFQFFMGDLSNFVPKALEAQADEPITVSCSWDKSQAPSISAYDDHDIFVSTRETCKISYKQEILEVSFDLNLVVRIIAEDDSLTFLITGANIFSPEWKVIDPQYQVSDENLARHYIAQLALGLKGRKVFGTGWKTLKRKFPVSFVSHEYLIIFGPSEV